MTAQPWRPVDIDKLAMQETCHAHHSQQAKTWQGLQSYPMIGPRTKQASSEAAVTHGNSQDYQ